MEIRSRPGMGDDGSCYISKQVKAETAAPGFRVKSGWAAAVLLTGPIGSPALRDNRLIDLSDPPTTPPLDNLKRMRRRQTGARVSCIA